ncbi:hypothetical protein MesoLj131b_77070 (plasmid) [Mesorhizobium sp. 131-2-5]|nr:hypothetical protein MesoLj131b_77070 [Mesorhizobium sp. 131-2-5]
MVWCEAPGFISIVASDLAASSTALTACYAFTALPNFPGNECLVRIDVTARTSRSVALARFRLGYAQRTQNGHGVPGRFHDAIRLFVVGTLTKLRRSKQTGSDD